MNKQFIKRQITLHKLGLPMDEDIKEYYDCFYQLIGDINELDKLLLDSIKFADANPSASQEYILKHSQIKDTDIIRKHINLYVNQYTKNIGETGRKAITKLASEALELGMIDKMEGEMFL